MKKHIVSTIAAATIGLSLPGAAQASRPVPRTVTGCVIHGTFTDGQYTYKVRTLAGQKMTETDIKRYEGQKIRIQGSLLPGDVLIARKIRVLSPNCRLQIR